MNPPTLREICQAATPGPWKAVGRCLEAPDGNLGLMNLARSDSVTEANAQLIARFHPETALAVYEALEGVLRVADRKTDEFDAVRRVLALLDGRTEP